MRFKELTIAFIAVGLVCVVALSGASEACAGRSEARIPDDAGTSGHALLDEFSAAFERAATRVSPSIVAIHSEHAATGEGLEQEELRRRFGNSFPFFGPMPGPGPHEQGFGSGVIVSADGYILTNNHVVEGASKVTVTLGDEKYAAKVVGTDPPTDLAVVKIEARNLPAARLGDSARAQVGQWVIAVGNPFQLERTVTTGIISATGRSSVGLASYEDFIQTDASINPGNSGGALADLDGNVIGINTAIESPNGGNVGIGFAIPIDMARSIMDKLIEDGVVARGYLGLVPQDVEGPLATALHLGVDEGALVGDVDPAGPAGKAGIRRGDVITRFDGQEIRDSIGLRHRVADAPPGTTVRVGIQRGGESLTIEVVLGERPSETASAASPDDDGAGARESLGLSVRPLTPDLASRLGYDQNGGGVVVDGIVPGSPAAETDIRPGDLIEEIDHEPVKTVDDLSKAAAELERGDTAAILVRRGPNTFYQAIEIPA
jgi:serine protease Do